MGHVYLGKHNGEDVWSTHVSLTSTRKYRGCGTCMLSRRECECTGTVVRVTNVTESTYEDGTVIKTTISIIDVD